MKRIFWHWSTPVVFIGYPASVFAIVVYSGLDAGVAGAVGGIVGYAMGSLWALGAYTRYEDGLES